MYLMKDKVKDFMSFAWRCIVLGGSVLLAIFFVAGIILTMMSITGCATFSSNYHERDRTVALHYTDVVPFGAFCRANFVISNPSHTKVATTKIACELKEERFVKEVFTTDNDIVIQPRTDRATSIILPSCEDQWSCRLITKP